MRKWKRIMSGAYFCGAALAILLGSGATIVAALGYSTKAAFLAGGATAIYGIEKALLLREKWAHHLSSEMGLRSLKKILAIEASPQPDPAGLPAHKPWQSSPGH